MALVQNMTVTPRPQGLDADWDLPSLTFPLRASGLRWEVRAGHTDVGTLLASQEWPRSYDRIQRWARNANNDAVAGFITEDGHAYWWGQIGHHYHLSPPAEPLTISWGTPTIVGLDGVVDMVHGPRHTLLLKDDGTVWGYGMATQGELGGSLVRNVKYTAPVQITSGASAIAIAGQRSFALLTNGNVVSWGAGGNPSGRNTTDSTTVPTPVATGATLIDGSPFGVVVWAPNHTTPGLYTWGDMPVIVLTQTHPLPLPSWMGQSFPTATRVTAIDGGSSIAQVALGPNGGFLRTSSGVLYPWGANTYGELGLGTTATHLSFNPYTRVVAGTGYGHVVMGRYHSLRVKHNVISQSGLISMIEETGSATISGLNTTSFTHRGTVEDSVPAGLSAILGTAFKHSFWVGHYLSGAGVSYGSNDHELLARNVNVQPAPWVGTPLRFRTNDSLPTSLSVPQGLQTATDYRVRVRLDTSDGNEDTAVVDATTLVGYDPPVVSITSGDRSLGATWTAAASTDPILNYTIRAYLDGVLVLENTTPGVLYSYGMLGLENGRTYEVWVKGNTASEQLTWGITTGTPDAVPNTPTSVTATPVTGVGVQLGWTPPSTHPNDGQLLGYRVRVQVAPSGVPQEVVLPDLFDAHDALLLPVSLFYDAGVLESQLVADSAWSFSIRAVGTLGEGPWTSYTGTPIEVVDWPAAPQQFRATNSEERFEFAWSSPSRPNFSGLRFQYRPYGELNWTTQLLPGTQRTLVLSNVSRGTLYEVQLISINGDLESAPVTLQLALREPYQQTITFRGAGTELSLPDPNSAELQIPGNVSPILTQSGFYLPVQAIDDMEASWSLRWSALPQRLVGPLETLQGLGTLTMNDPLDLVTFGYIENVDYQGIPGATDQETGEALYEASAEFRVIRMELPAVLGELPDGEHPLDTRFGISAQGVPPLAVAGSAWSVGWVEDGWFWSGGGEASPWGDVVSPVGDVWDRPERATPTAPGSPVEGEPEAIADWTTNWLELDASTLPPEIGTAYVGVLPFENAVPPVELDDPTADDLSAGSAPGAYYAYWDALDADRFIEGLGPCTIRHELVGLDLPVTTYLPLGVRFTLLDPDGDDTLRYRQEFGVATRYLENLPARAPAGGGIDSDGQAKPGPGVYLRRDLRRADGTLVERRYLPAQWRYDARDLYPTTETHNVRLYVLGLLTTSLQAQVTANPDHMFGAQLLADPDALFGWLDRSTPGDFTSLEMPWSPGRAGPYERVLMGSGQRSDAGWLVYALDRSLIVEFWRDGTLIASRALDLSELTHDASNGDRYLVALGYDYRRGRVALGVSRRGASPAYVYRSWAVLDLIGHGYRDAVLHLGAVPVTHDDGGVYFKSSWARVRPVDNGFVREGFLTPGSLASLMEHLP